MSKMSYKHLLVSKEEKALGQQFNVGTGNSTTLLELIQTINQILEVELLLDYQRRKEQGDIHDSLADITKLSALGYQPKHSILDGMRKYLATEINTTKS